MFRFICHQFALFLCQRGGGGGGGGGARGGTFPVLRMQLLFRCAIPNPAVLFPTPNPNIAPFFGCISPSLPLDLEGGGIIE